MREVVEVGLPLALAFIMFSLGLELTGGDFKRVFVRPKAFMLGACGQLIVLPVVAFLIVSLLPLAPEIAMGVMLVAAVPGGVTSNLLTRYAGGDTALSISLTALISLVSMVTVPVVVFLALRHFGGMELTRVSVVTTALAMFGMVAVPVGSGVLVRARASSFAQAVQAPARYFSGALLVVVVATAFIGADDAWRGYFAQAGLATIVLNVSMMALAYGGAALAGLERPQRIALSLECGLQSVTMAVVLVVLLGLPTVYAIPAAVYGMIMLVTASLFAGFLARAEISGAVARAAGRS